MSSSADEGDIETATGCTAKSERIDAAAAVDETCDNGAGFEDQRIVACPELNSRNNERIRGNRPRVAQGRRLAARDIHGDKRIAVNRCALKIIDNERAAVLRRKNSSFGTSARGSDQSMIVDGAGDVCRIDRDGIAHIHSVVVYDLPIVRNREPVAGSTDQVSICILIECDSPVVGDGLIGTRKSHDRVDSLCATIERRCAMDGIQGAASIDRQFRARCRSGHIDPAIQCPARLNREDLRWCC
ncbi:MAG: hypothetical protein ACTHM2_20000 [Afipia sp.]